MPLTRFAVLLTLLIVGVILPPVHAQTPDIEDTTSVAAQATPTPQPFDRITERVSQLRHLPFLTPVTTQIMSRDDLAAFEEQSFFRDNSPEQRDAEQTLLETLGLIPRGYDLSQLFTDLISENPGGGIYDPVTKTVYAVGTQSELQPQDTLDVAHAMLEALDDQHFNVKDGEDARQKNNDQSLAYQGLVEGNALLGQTLYAARYLPDLAAQSLDEGDQLSPTLQNAPLVVRRELLFPGDSGVQFLLEAFLDGSWEAIDNIWANPPVSTSQILHPDKYAAGETPVSLDLPDIQAKLGPEWTQIDDSTLGELDLRTLVEQYVDETTADRATSGWAGDHYQLFRRDADGAVVLAMRTSWERTADARAFFSAYQKVAQARHGASLEDLPLSSLGISEPTPAGIWAATDGETTHGLVRDGNSVGLVVSTDPIGLTLMNSLRP